MTPIAALFGIPWLFAGAGTGPALMVLAGAAVVIGVVALRTWTKAVEAIVRGWLDRLGGRARVGRFAKLALVTAVLMLATGSAPLGASPERLGLAAALSAVVLLGTVSNAGFALRGGLNLLPQRGAWLAMSLVGTFVVNVLWLVPGAVTGSGLGAWISGLYAATAVMFGLGAANAAYNVVRDVEQPVNRVVDWLVTWVAFPVTSNVGNALYTFSVGWVAFDPVMLAVTVVLSVAFAYPSYLGMVEAVRPGRFGEAYLKVMGAAGNVSLLYWGLIALWPGYWLEFVGAGVALGVVVAVARGVSKLAAWRARLTHSPPAFWAGVVAAWLGIGLAVGLPLDRPITITAVAGIGTVHALWILHQLVPPAAGPAGGGATLRGGGELTRSQGARLAKWLAGQFRGGRTIAGHVAVRDANGNEVGVLQLLPVRGLAAWVARALGVGATAQANPVASAFSLAMTGVFAVGAFGTQALLAITAVAGLLAVAAVVRMVSDHSRTRSSASTTDVRTRGPVAKVIKWLTGLFLRNGPPVRAWAGHLWDNTKLVRVAAVVATAAALVVLLSLPASAVSQSAPSAAAGGGWLAGAVAGALDALVPAGPVVVGVVLVARGLAAWRSRGMAKRLSGWAGIGRAGVVKAGRGVAGVDVVRLLVWAERVLEAGRAVSGRGCAVRRVHGGGVGRRGVGDGSGAGLGIRGCCWGWRTGWASASTSGGCWRCWRSWPRGRSRWWCESWTPMVWCGGGPASC